MRELEIEMVEELLDVLLDEEIKREEDLMDADTLQDLIQ